MPNGDRHFQLLPSHKNVSRTVSKKLTVFKVKKKYKIGIKKDGFYRLQVYSLALNASCFFFLLFFQKCVERPTLIKYLCDYGHNKLYTNFSHTTYHTLLNIYVKKSPLFM